MSQINQNRWIENGKVKQDLKFGNEKTLKQNDKLNHNPETQPLVRYMKCINKLDNSFYYVDLSPGVEKPKDTNDFTYEYCSRLDALKHLYIMNYGFEAYVRFIEAYTKHRNKSKIHSLDRANQMIELELIRGTHAEKILKQKGIGNNLKIK